MSRVRVHVYDVTGATYQATLTNATGVKWQHPLAGEGMSAGTATFSLMASDAQASQLVRDRIVKMHWNGAIRCGFRIHQIARVLTDQGFRLDVTAIQLRCLLGDAVALPEYGVRVGAGETRPFGFMSIQGAWYVSSEWVTPGTITLTRPPEGWLDSSAKWLSAPTQPPVGGKTWYRKTFSTTTTYQATKLYIAVDDSADVFLDGELVMQIQVTPGIHRFTQTVDVNLPVGDHVLAVEMRDDDQWAGEALRGELLCTLASVTTSTSTTDPLADTISQVIMRSDSSATWKVRYDNTSEPGWRKAQVVKQLFTEASARGVRGCAALTLDFDDTNDTSGSPWTDRGHYEVQTLSDPFDRQIESLFDPSIDWDVDAATRKVQAWKRRGQNRTTGSTPVVLALRPKRTDLAITETYDVTTSLYGRTADGLVVHISDSTAQTAAGGVVEGGMSLGSVASTQTATDVMTAHLDSLGYVTKEVTAALSPDGPVPYVDYFLGDTVAIPDGAGHYLAVRVLAITVDASGDTVVAYPDLAVDRTVTL